MFRDIIAQFCDICVFLDEEWKSRDKTAFISDGFLNSPEPPMDNELRQMKQKRISFQKL